MNANLTKEFIEEELRLAYFELAPNKALGPDGYTTRFYQLHWETVREDIVQAAKSFFDLGHLLREFNNTVIAWCHR